MIWSLGSLQIRVFAGNISNHKFPSKSLILDDLLLLFLTTYIDFKNTNYVLIKHSHRPYTGAKNNVGTYIVYIIHCFPVELKQTETIFRPS